MTLHRSWLLLSGTLASGLALATPYTGGLNFDSPGVLNLSLRPPHIDGKRLAPKPLAASIEQEIFAAKKVEENPTLLEKLTEPFDCGKQDCEKKHIAASLGTVKRIDKRLEVAGGSGPTAVFIDIDIPATEGRERDAYSFGYFGRLLGSGYHRVQEDFSDDSPGDFLINPRNGKLAFVHPYDDVVLPAPDGLHLVTVNYLNLPFAVRVASLDASGPRVELLCAASREDRTSKATLKGWHNANTLDLQIDTGTSTTKQKIALRATREAGTWRIATNDAAALDAADITCTTP